MGCAASYNHILFRINPSASYKDGAVVQISLRAPNALIQNLEIVVWNHWDFSLWNKAENLAVLCFEFYCRLIVSARVCSVFAFPGPEIRFIVPNNAFARTYNVFGTFWDLWFFTNFVYDLPKKSAARKAYWYVIW